ncbi:TonB-dependent receptor plug domain-containing protein [Winogradskyella wichelsiae]|uniref:TonB-dependent receptor plug domain-containing protein n=1 Tax=Winogradskyella wichelsiae TaxID=2697007 RepID=UPI0015C87644|nr:TonB-dependent receptor plug domain-containing protein [Winogradskyella wichelsiae]
MKLKYTLFLAAFTFSLIGFTQKKTKKVAITVMVKDSLGNAVSDAIIFLDDDKNRKTTNRKGLLKIKASEYPINISAYSEKEGFQTTEFNVSEDVVITFNSNSLIKGKYLELLAMEGKKKTRKKEEQYFTNIFDYLRVKQPMLKISSDNQIRVRGYDTSFNGSSEPLFIVNGSPTSAISDIVPSSIKNVTILKDGLAASYGFRGANGVIIINYN